MSALRTLILGLDGATFDLIDPLVNAGYLPTLAHVMHQGTRATLNAFPDMNSAAAWSTLVTGYNAGEHGIFHFDANWYRLSQKGIKTRPTLGADRKRDPFWRILSAAGQSVGVINVPVSFPADSLNGFMLAGMDTPGVHSRGFCYPASLHAELRAQGIAYEIDTLNLSQLAQQQPYQLPKQITRMTDARARTLLYLMARRSWDVLMGVFVGTDRVQHFFWQDETTDVNAPSWQPLRELYQQFDAFLAQALTRLESNANLLIVSDHGFGPKRGALHSLNELFARWGLLHYSAHIRDVRGTLLAKALQYGRRIVPAAMQYPLARLFPGLQLRAMTAHGFSKLDWAQTKLFADPDGWGVYINLQGREPEGIVPQSEYEALRQQARMQLLQLRDGETNRRIIRAVYDRETMFQGPFMERAPDLVIEWDFETVRDLLAYEKNGERIIVHPAQDSSSEGKWKATHRPDGILIAYGPHIQRDHIVSNVSLCDIAPTILYLQDQAIPVGIEGKVIGALFTSEFLETHPIRVSEAMKTPSSANPLSAPEMHLVEQRLRALGYLDQ